MFNPTDFYWPAHPYMTCRECCFCEQSVTIDGDVECGCQFYYIDSEDESACDDCFVIIYLSDDELEYWKD